MDVDRYVERLRLLIQENKVRLSRPSSLNDPFDCKTLFTTRGADEHSLRAFLESTIARDGNEQSLRLIDLAMERVRESGIEQAIKALRSRYEQFHIEEVDKYGIICFSAFCESPCPASLLMWSHYSSGHRGLCLQFRKDPLVDNFTCKQVCYTERYPTLDQVAASEGEKLAELILYRKSPDWMYESEWRLLSPLAQSDGGFLRLPTDALSAVVVGCEASAKDCERVYDWLQERDGEPVPLYRARKHSEKYEILVDKLLAQPTSR